MEWRWELATRDSATGLPNAAIYRDRLGVALEHARRQDRPLCVLLASLPPLEPAEIGEIGTAVAAAIRSSDTVARFGRHDLALVLPGLGEVTDVHGVVGRIRGASGGRLAAVGFAVAPADAADAESLLHVATRRRDDPASLDGP